MSASFALDFSGTPPPTDKYSRIADDLARQGWSVQDGFIADALTAALKAEALLLRDAGAYRRAAVGRGDAQQLRPELRGDRIVWLDGVDTGPATQTYLRELESLRLSLNRGLFLGLFDFEGHLAEYPPGAFYRRHLDQHQDSDSRVVSCVLYLNPGWTPGDGGELRLYLPQAQPGELDIAPRGGTLVCFLSSVFEHEVLPARKPRHSLTGWFRRREA